MQEALANRAEEKIKIRNRMALNEALLSAKFVPVADESAVGIDVSTALPPRNEVFAEDCLSVE